MSKELSLPAQISSLPMLLLYNELRTSSLFNTPSSPYLQYLQTCLVGFTESTDNLQVPFDKDMI